MHVRAHIPELALTNVYRTAQIIASHFKTIIELTWQQTCDMLCVRCLEMVPLRVSTRGSGEGGTRVRKTVESLSEV